MSGSGTPGGRGVLRLAVGGLALGSLLHVGSLLPRYLEVARIVPPEVRAVAWGVFFSIATAVGASVLSLILVVRSWGRVGARSLATHLALVSVAWGSLLRFLQVTVVDRQLSLEVTVGGLDLLLASLGLTLAAASFVRFSTLFPEPSDGAAPVPQVGGSRLKRIRRGLSRPTVIWPLAVIVGLLPRFLGVVTSLLPEAWRPTLAPSSLPTLIVLGAVCMVVLPLAGILLGVRNLAEGYALADESDRRRVLWLVGGAATAGILIVAPAVGLPALVALGVELPELAVGLGAAMVVAAPAVLVMAAGAAMFYSGAVDPALTLKRSTLLSGLGGLGLLVFAGLENLLSEWAAAALGLPGSAGSILAGAVAAGVMWPVRIAVGRLTGTGRGSPHTR